MELTHCLLFACIASANTPTNVWDLGVCVAICATTAICVLLLVRLGIFAICRSNNLSSQIEHNKHEIDKLKNQIGDPKELEDKDHSKVIRDLRNRVADLEKKYAENK